MPFQKGCPGGPGRKKGVPLKATVEVKAAIEMAFQGIGGVPALTEWAKENQSDFYKGVWARILPRDMIIDAGGNLARILEEASRILGEVKPPAPPPAAKP
jgi:hypothetical protein